MNRAERRATGQSGRVRIADLPDDLAQVVHASCMCKAIEGLIRRGVFPNDQPAVVHNAIEYLMQVRDATLDQAQGHPRFAEFFPKEARELEQQRRGAGIIAIPDGLEH